MELWDSPSCSGERSGVPSLPEMTLGLFPAGDLKGLTHPFINLRTSQKPQERQDSYLALSAVRPEQLLVQGQEKNPCVGLFATLGLSEDLYPSCLSFTSISALWVPRGKTVNPHGGSVHRYISISSARHGDESASLFIISRSFCAMLFQGVASPVSRG